jgi:hypothetical protein
MPSRYNYETQTTERRCPGCSAWFPQTAEFFYVRPSTGRAEKCLACHRAYYTARSANRSQRRSNTPAAPIVRRFGVEIEFKGDRMRVCEALRAEGLNADVEGYNHHTRSYWKVVTDASVRGGGELVSPPLSGEEGRRQLAAACRALKAAGATVDKECGLHVHHEVRDLDRSAFGRVFRQWFLNQDLINGLVSPSRRGSNPYCKQLTGSLLDAVAGITSWSQLRRFDRYFTLNPTSYPKYGTLEIRQHQGTINAAKIIAWIDFGQAMIESAKRQETCERSDSVVTLLATLHDRYGLSENASTYLTGRSVVLAGAAR